MRRARNVADVCPCYAFGIKPAVRGQIAYRVWFPADADHAQAFTVNKILTVS
jgi:hypothetical protein